MRRYQVCASPVRPGAVIVAAIVLAFGASVASAQCGAAGSGDCCAGNGSAFCHDVACCEAVCAIDPYCCDPVEGEWDACCAHLAFEHCPQQDWPDLSICVAPPPPPTCGSGSGHCCILNGSPGCDTEWCCQLVCANDPFCCDILWDHECIEAAKADCALCFGTPAFAPILPAFSCKYNCGGAAISGCWCDEACCVFGDCCVDKGDHCVGCGYGLGPPKFYGDWCIDNGCGGTSFSGCGCDEGCFERGDCCSTVCLEWDCPHLVGCTPPNPADLTGDNIVGVPDLLILLANWGECQFDRCFVMEECPGDFNHDGDVGVADLLFLLQSWG